MERLAADGWGGLFETARALGEETRFKIYRAVCLSSDPVPVTRLAAAFSLHPNAVRQHLGRLEQAGLVVSRADREGVGAGRPRRLYEPSPEPVDFVHPPRSMRALVRMLAEAVSAVPSERKDLVAFGRRWGQSWGAKRKRENGAAPRSRRGKAELLARELRAWGWQPTTERRAGATYVRTERCLFRDLAPSANGRCCALEEGLLTGLTESLLNGHARLVHAAGCTLEVAL